MCERTFDFPFPGGKCERVVVGELRKLIKWVAQDFKGVEKKLARIKGHVFVAGKLVCIYASPL